ncbi:60S ribosome biogenesis protein Rrp14-domain-containing protein [Phycomyces nitens]|nr:60S ribosome biogenesis protein Rrp14-domain-containing protein [Phycomyces nitens]
MANQQLLETLPERMTAHAQLFDSLLHLIPAKFYVTEKNDDPTGSKFMHNKRKKAPKQVIKEATKKAKKAKLDPENKKSIAEIQQEKAAQLKEEEGSESEESEVEQVEDDDDEEDEDEEDDEDDEDDEEPKKVNLGNAKFSGLGDDDEEESAPVASEVAGKSAIR